MKQKYVPLEKRQKKQQREFYQQQRSGWGNLNPVTKKVPNKKAYDRKKARQWREHEPVSGFFVVVKLYSEIIRNRSSLSRQNRPKTLTSRFRVPL